MFSKICLILSLSLFFNVTVWAQNDLSHYIPKDVFVYIQVNGDSLNNKIDFDAIRSTDLYKDFIFKLSDNRSAEDRAIVKLFENPDETGINFKAPMYFYNFLIENDAPSKSKKVKYDNYYEVDAYDTDIDTRELLTIYLLPILNVNDFQSFVKNLFEKEIKISKWGKVGYYFIKDGVIFYFDKEKLIITVLPESARSFNYNTYSYKPVSPAVVKKFIQVSIKDYSTASISQNDTIIKLRKTASDVIVYQNMPKLKNMNNLWEEINDTSYLKNPNLFSNALIDSISYTNCLSFDNGIIRSIGNSNYSSALGNIINPIFQVTPSESFASLIYQAPVTSYLNYSVSIKALHHFVDSNFKINMDTIVFKTYRKYAANQMESDKSIKAYRDKIDSIHHYLYKDYGKPKSNVRSSNIKAETDSGTVYKEENDYVYTYSWHQSRDEYELNDNINWYEQDSLEQVIDSLQILIENRKDTVAKNELLRMGIKGDDVWNLFKGDILFMYHAMTSIEQKYIDYETDEEFNTKEVEKTKKIPFPLFTLALSGGDKETIERYLKLATEEGILKKEGKRYLIIPGNFNSYLWFDGSNIIITNDNNIQPNKKSASSISAFEKENYDRIIENSNSYFVEIGKILSSTSHYMEDKEVAEILEILASYFDETESFTRQTHTNGYRNEQYISFNDTSKNSINLLVDMVNAIYVHFKK
ncbi:MAG: hypothetical protein MUE33_10990 [Cytophagaceae bacterium]|jgi:hypothetical protein|nr:hypothetical protein [Cytophagaceae bacterium]